MANTSLMPSTCKNLSTISWPSLSVLSATGQNETNITSLSAKAKMLSKGEGRGGKGEGGKGERGEEGGARGEEGGKGGGRGEEGGRKGGGKKGEGWGEPEQGQHLHKDHMIPM